MLEFMRMNKLKCNQGIIKKHTEKAISIGTSKFNRDLLCNFKKYDNKAAGG